MIADRRASMERFTNSSNHMTAASWAYKDFTSNRKPLPDSLVPEYTIRQGQTLTGAQQQLIRRAMRTRNGLKRRDGVPNPASLRFNEGDYFGNSEPSRNGVCQDGKVKWHPPANFGIFSPTNIGNESNKPYGECWPACLPGEKRSQAFKGANGKLLGECYVPTTRKPAGSRK